MLRNLGSTCFKINKVVLCTGDLIAAMVSYLFLPEVVVVSCRPGMSSWSVGICDDRIRYKDMAFHQGNLYAVANEGELLTHEVIEGSDDTEEPMVSRVQRVIRAPAPINRRVYYVPERKIKYNLVISITGKLLMVRWFVPHRYSFKDTKKDLNMDVFEADFVRSVWVEVQRLDDQVLFISSNCSKAMSASTDCYHLQGNKIYVLDNEDMDFEYICPKQRSCGRVYDMRSKSSHPIFVGEEICDQWRAAWLFP